MSIQYMDELSRPQKIWYILKLLWGLRVVTVDDLAIMLHSTPNVIYAAFTDSSKRQLLDVALNSLLTDEDMDKILSHITNFTATKRSYNIREILRKNY